ncbi:GNAT family N-acetyltransferase [Kitasatospora sp. RB6PN24]|uniref:GNAT family N-acetyltransferase n=1 Tax=Kitasatospora humi TaxID=2893891 RepID=UPI001E40D973|nr:GNAT family N-acetyltransferase [Kitasatospora humi]MCC9305617.1 GNAT family N-acetyltransferase [Kitasatospora humi]
MTRLIDPTGRLRASFVAAVAEFRADRANPPSWFVEDIEPAALTDPAAFDRYVARVLAERDERTARPAGIVPMTTLWWAGGDDFIGRLAIRHQLTPALERVGGHIGYDVRPSMRRRGHATAMLAAALPEAAALGIHRALLMCDATNTGSRRVIELAGGEFIDRVGAKLRFWVPTGG